MKTNKLIKAAGVILLGVALSLNLQASSDRNSRNARTAFSQITHTVKLTGDDIRNMQMLLAQSDAVHITWNNHELRFALRDGEVPEYTIRFEALNDEPVEDWMFESGYLGEESEASVESWMLADDYLQTENQVIEDWMMSESYLGVQEPAPMVESWMLDANYLSK